MRRVSESGLVEHIAIVIQGRGVGGERQADLPFAAGLVELHRALVKLGEIVLALLDQRSQVQPQAMESLGAGDTGRPDDVGRIARTDLGRERVKGRFVVHYFKHQLDIRVRGVEFFYDFIFDLCLFRIITGPYTTKPANFDLVGSGRFSGLGRCLGRFWRFGGCRGMGGRRAAAGRDKERQD